MIINSDLAPWLLTDKMRGSLAGVYYDKAKHSLIATNGHALAVMPIREDDEDESGIIPVEALKEAIKASKKRNGLPATLTVKDGRVTAPNANGQSWQLINQQYPNFEQVYPMFEYPGITRTAILSINPYVLLKLWEAAGGEEGGCARIEFALDSEDRNAQQPIRVTGLHNATVACFMPMRDGASRVSNRVEDIEMAHGDAILHDQTLGRVEDIESACLLAEIEAVNRAMAVL